MTTLLHEWWAQIVALITIVAWGTRLEFRANRNTDDLVRFELRLAEQRKEDREEMAKQRAEDRENRDRDWSQMLKRMDEMQADIKKLLERRG